VEVLKQVAEIDLEKLMTQEVKAEDMEGNWEKK